MPVAYIVPCTLSRVAPDTSSPVANGKTLPTSEICWVSRSFWPSLILFFFYKTNPFLLVMYCFLKQRCIYCTYPMAQHLSVMSTGINSDLMKLNNICRYWIKNSRSEKKKPSRKDILEQSWKGGLVYFLPSGCRIILYSLCRTIQNGFWVQSVLFSCSAFLFSFSAPMTWLNLSVLVFRWSEAHHQTEALGPFWSFDGKIWVVPRGRSCIHRLLITYVGAGPRETSYGSRVSQAPLA